MNHLEPIQAGRDAFEGEPIAIVGMSCLFAGADSPSLFWRNIVDGVDCVTDPPPGWHAELFCNPERNPYPVYTPKGGYLGDLCRFNPAKYGVMPTSVEGGEPDQFIALRCAHEAMVDAGVPEIALNREKTGVILGRGIYVNRGVLNMMLLGSVIDQVVDLLRRLEPDRDEAQLGVIRDELTRNIASFSIDAVPSLMHCSMTGRIANRLDLKGPSYSLDAACASTLIAVEHGVRELRSGRCDAVLAGGVQVSTLGYIHQLFCLIEALSRSGRIAPFSAEAQGVLLGEGCGMMVLKRRSDALRDGNRIYALVRAVGVSSDGRGAGLLAPRTEGQQLAIRRAFEESGLAPSSIGYVEAHGTGIPVGDQTEIESLSACFGGRMGGRPTIGLGSVKSMIGHPIQAAGAASLIKASLALYHRTLPPTLHAERPHPALGLEKTPFYLSTKTRPWVHGDRDAPRRAGVNAFGFGGINAHVILEDCHDGDEASLEDMADWPVELFVISAADTEALRARVESLREWVVAAEGVRLLDLAAACAAEEGACRVAIVAADLDDLARKLGRVPDLLIEPGREKIQDRGGIFWYRRPLARDGRVAFVFPGEGAQYPNMLSELCRHFPAARREFDLTDTALARIGAEAPISRLVFPLAEEADEAESVLARFENAVMSLSASERALNSVLRQFGVMPDAIVGHSTGEFVALLAAGALMPADEEDCIEGVSRGADNAAWLARSGCVPVAAMMTVGGADRDLIDRAVEASGGLVELAMDNCPNQVVLVGDDSAMAEVQNSLRDKGGLCVRLPWGGSYHTEAFAPACSSLDEF